MRYAGIDVASEKHFVAVISGEGEVLQKARPFVEDAEGYAELFKTLGGAGEVLVAMEATGYPGGALLVAFGPVTWARWARRQKMARS